MELACAVLILNLLMGFSLGCYMRLPTGAFMVTTEADDDIDDPASQSPSYEAYDVNFATPYTSFLCCVLSGLCSIFVAYVHWRTPSWNSEIKEADW